MKSKDIFKNCFSIGYLILVIFLVIIIFTPQPLKGYLYVLFFFVAGAMCLINFNRCKRAHCQITGWGFLGIGVLILLKVLKVANISENIIWAILFITLAVGFGIEFLNMKKYGSCYVKKK